MSSIVLHPCDSDMEDYACSNEVISMLMMEIMEAMIIVVVRSHGDCYFDGEYCEKY